jgi:hypothetical protein
LADLRSAAELISRIIALLLVSPPMTLFIAARHYFNKGQIHHPARFGDRALELTFGVNRARSISVPRGGSPMR